MKPTIGRVVLYHPLPDEVDHEHSQAFPALVCHVHNEEGTSIAIGGFTDQGQPFSRSKLNFVDGTSCSAGEACWMEYQKAVEKAGMLTTALQETGTLKEAVVEAKADSAKPATKSLSKG